jgi:hypothetical protein
MTGEWQRWQKGMTEVAEGREVARKLLGYDIRENYARRRKRYNINKGILYIKNYI